MWKDIKTLPDTGKQYLVGFMGQFKWYSYVIEGFGEKTGYGQFAKPTHWCEIPEPPK